MKMYSTVKYNIIYYIIILAIIMRAHCCNYEVEMFPSGSMFYSRKDYTYCCS